jgi:uncharacterized membrane protein YadS
MQTDLIKLWFTYATATILIIGGTLILFVAWLQPIDSTNPRDLAILFGVVGAEIGGATAFMFNAESAKSATRAAQSSTASGAAITSGGTPPPPNPPTA